MQESRKVLRNYFYLLFLLLLLRNNFGLLDMEYVMAIVTSFVNTECSLLSKFLEFLERGHFSKAEGYSPVFPQVEPLVK